MPTTSRRSTEVGWTPTLTSTPRATRTPPSGHPPQVTSPRSTGRRSCGPPGAASATSPRLTPPPSHAPAPSADRRPPECGATTLSQPAGKDRPRTSPSKAHPRHTRHRLRPTTRRLTRPSWPLWRVRRTCWTTRGIGSRPPHRRPHTRPSKRWAWRGTRQHSRQRQRPRHSRVRRRPHPRPRPARHQPCMGMGRRAWCPIPGWRVSRSWVRCCPTQTRSRWTRRPSLRCDSTTRCRSTRRSGSSRLWRCCSRTSATGRART
mmetsp:Transcript_18029/g.51276  ORF Transcript_18029/g.51276 Transcript_18029/m.51276 type:complete len:261 (-) Transcript_18029:657-1439(-)